MAQTTRSPRTSAARFARTSPSPGAGRFARSSSSPGAGRFARPGSSQTRPRRTPTRAGSRTPVPFARPGGRKGKQQKGIAGALAGLLPTGAAAKAKPGSKTGRAGGLAVLAAASGVAFRNRDKLTAMLKRRREGGGEGSEAPLTTPAPRPAQPVPPTDAV
jgi:hypothetical protein